MFNNTLTDIGQGILSTDIWSQQQLNLQQWQLGLYAQQQAFRPAESYIEPYKPPKKTYNRFIDSLRAEIKDWCEGILNN
jgi:hypothetical protein